MSDIEFSASESDPISDVNPEEMARLMADIDQMDDDIYKSGSKSSGGQKGAGADSGEGSKKVTFKDSSKTSKKPPKPSNDDDDDDWDADDLLFSDDESKPKKPQPKPAKPAVASSPASERGRGKMTNKTRNTGTELEESPIISKKSDVKKSDPITPKKDKSKLMEDLFGGEDDSKPIKTSPMKDQTTRRPEVKKPRGRSKDEVTFDDDDDDLLGDLGDQPKKKVHSSPKDDNFLSSLLVKSPSTAISKQKQKPTDFVLDEKYKNPGKEDGNKESLGSYMPTAKAASPRRKSPGASRSSPDNFLDSEPRRRNPRGPAPKKPFELDDDDILGNLRSRRGVKKEIAQPDPIAEPKKPSTAKAKKDDWLFGSPENQVPDTKKTSENTTPTSGKQENSAGEKDDWLGSLLTNKKPTKTEDSPVGASSNVSPNLKFGNSSVSPGRPRTSPSIGQPSSDITDASPHRTETDVTSGSTRVQSAPSIVTTKQGEDATMMMAAQQQQLELSMTQQLQQQQQLMAQVMKQQMEAAEKRYQENLLALQQQQQLSLINTPVITTPATVPMPPTSTTTSDNTKSLEVELRTAEMEVARLKAEVDALRKQHTDEMAMLEDAHKRKFNVEREVWERVESRLREERDSLMTDFHAKLASLQEEKERLGASYESQLAGVRTEWEGAVQRTKELYVGMVTRMKEEHESALERLTHLKELELKAALSASGHVKEAEVVMMQLENNTTNLSQLTAVVNTQHDTALEMTQRALKLKEKQLKDLENELTASRAEMESERARLNTLIQRLENALTSQGSEVEKERWRLAQEKMKLEVERHSLSEERKHLMLSTETERQSLATARESLMSEHRSLLQSVAQQRQELATKQAKINAWERQSSATGFMNESVGVLREEQRVRERLASTTRKQDHLREKEQMLDQLSEQLDQEKTKVKLEKEVVNKEQTAVAKSQLEMERAKEMLERDRAEQQQRLAQITAQTRALHVHQEKIDADQQRLYELREDVVRLSQKGMCVRCQMAGGARDMIGASIGINTFNNTRLPGDGGEGITAASFSLDTSTRADMSLASVLARLTAARQHHNAEREKRLQQISALESS